MSPASSPIDRLKRLYGKLGDEGMYVDQNTVALAMDIIEYAERRAVSRAAYPHACIEDRKMRDLLDGTSLQEVQTTRVIQA